MKPRRPSPPPSSSGSSSEPEESASLRMDILTRLRVATPAPPAPQPDDPSLPTAKHPVSGDEHHALEFGYQELADQDVSITPREGRSYHNPRGWSASRVHNTRKLTSHTGFIFTLSRSSIRRFGKLDPRHAAENNSKSMAPRLKETNIFKKN